MDDRRFVACLNEVLVTSSLDLAAPADPLDPGYIAAWAEFVRACVARGVEVGDTRWGRLTVAMEDGEPRFRVNDESPKEDESGEPDFGVGLALLMSLLGRDKR